MLSVLGVLFDGIAYGSLLFIIAVGLSVTLGLMNFVNLAHGAFAMLGGYMAVMAMTRAGIPFLAALPLAFIASAIVGVALERTLYQRLYKANHLDQVLFSIGLVFMSIATATYFFGASQQPVQLPAYLQGQIHLPGIDIGTYRLFLIAVVAVLTIALQWLLEKTRFGSQVRASVDNATAAAGLGINVNKVFALTFALGSGLAGLGGALGIDVLGLDPTFPLKYMVYFLLVVAVGGTGTIKGTLIASLILGIFDVAGKYYVPQIGGFVIYALMVVLLILFPTGLYGKKDMSAQTPTVDTPAGPSAHALPNGRWSALEMAFWLVPAAIFFLLPDYRVLGSQILITGLFAMSLDLILGYAGIVSLGHAAFFGLGAYAAALLAKNGISDPLLGLVGAAIAAAIAGYIVSFLVVRGGDLTRLIITLGIGLMLWEVANKASFITGGVDGLSFTAGKLFGIWNFDLGGRTAYIYALVVAFIVFLFARRLVDSPLGLSLRGIREGGKRMPAIGAPVILRLQTVFTIAAGIAGIAGGLLAQTTQFVGIDSLGFPRSAELMIMLVLGGTGRLYGAFLGAAVFMIAHDLLAEINPVYWEFWIGAFLVVIVLFAKGGILGGLEMLRDRFAAKRSGA